MSTSTNRRDQFDPSDADGSANNPQTNTNGTRQGPYQNVETSVNNPNYFDDDYAVKRENEISDDEARSEQNDRPGKS